MTKHLLFLLLAGLFVPAISLANDYEPSGPASVTFDGEIFEFHDTDTSGKSPVQSVREYFPSGSNMNSWTKLFAIWKYTGISDPMTALLLKERGIKTANPSAPTYKVKNKDNGQTLIDFITWPTGDLQHVAFAEWDVFKFEPGPNHTVIAYQYALRGYREDTLPFINRMKSERMRLDKLMGDFELNTNANGSASAEPSSVLPDPRNYDASQ